MGFYDTVRFEGADATHGIQPGDEFQTKNLFSISERFTITADGKLMRHHVRYESSSGNVHPLTGTPLPLLKAVPTGDSLFDFHGDMLLYGASKDLVARFTHGQLEWLKSADDYPEEHRILLLEQGAR
jgi:hypothetical protein